MPVSGPTTEATALSRARDDEVRDAYVEMVLDIVAAIPPGRVMAYGQIADIVERGGPRQVGRVMSLHGAAVPWWRVVTAAGRPPRCHAHTALERLRAEGTPLRGELVDMRRAVWDVGGPCWDRRS